MIALELGKIDLVIFILAVIFIDESLYQFAKSVDYGMSILYVYSFDKARQTVVIGKIPSLSLRVAVAAHNKYHLADILGVLQVFFATFKESLVVATENTFYWGHSTLFNMSDVAIE